MNVTNQILQKLKCSKCEYYLSQAPIFVQENSQAFCGRCEIPNDEQTRNIFRMLPFENLLPMFSFPCMFEKDGCREIIPYMKLKTHEESCKYKKYKCPVVPSKLCDWVGSYQELYEHCNLKHLHRILNHPCVLEHDITKDSSEYYVTLLSGYLFLIKAKVCLTTQKIYHSVHYIGDIGDLTELKFKLDIKRNEEMIIKKGVIVHLENKKNTSVVCGINRFTDTNILTTQILIQMKNGLKCDICEINDREYFGKYCLECAEKRRPCCNKQKGCKYIDASVKTDKHEKLFCMYQNWCFICGKNLIDYPMSSNHYCIAHEDKTYKANEYWEINFDNILNESNEYNFIIDTRGLDYCFGILKKDNLSQIVMSLSASKLTEEIRKYICTIKMKGKSKGHELQLVMPFTVDCKEDWTIILPISYLGSLGADLTETLISFDIRKNYN